MLEFNWRCVNYNSTFLLLQLNFTNPLYVSFGGSDIVNIAVINRTYF